MMLLAVGSASWAQTSRPVEYAAPVAVCELQDRRITETSGIVPSHRNPGCYYVHNDSGDHPRVFLVDRAGRTRLTIRLKNATAVDFEDIALAPGKRPGTCDVCVADIGDNLARRSSVTIYRFPEVPAPVDKSGVTTDQSVARASSLCSHRQDAGATEVESVAQASSPCSHRQDAGATEVEPVAYHVRYADGPANAEAFFVHPRTGDGYFLTKRKDGRSVVYKLAAPWNAKTETVLPRLLTLELPPAFALARIVTGADISPDGRRLAVRCYVNGWEWRLPPDANDSAFDRIFQARPVQLTLPPEEQGEALCYAADGQALLTVSEGKSPTLYELPVAAP
ncbi:MAG: hypothetical protein KAY37_01360 [Phycisphaerae bacterium]|nr:hypothetical protein [Phycisphaerae bacterium]